MLNLKIAFDQPWWLLLLVLVPILWIFSFRSLSGLGPYRRLFALGFRTIVLVLMVLCLAEVQLKKISDRVTVMYLLDQSESIPKITREAMLKYVMEDVSKRLVNDMAKCIQANLEADEPAVENDVVAAVERSAPPQPRPVVATASPVSAFGLLWHLVKVRVARLFGRSA